AIGAFVPHDNSLAVYAALALALAPAVLLAALNARFSAAPFTAVMVFFGPTITHTGPIAAAFERVIEVAVGCVVGLFVSLVVLPARAHDFVIEAATQMLALWRNFCPSCSRALPEASIGRCSRRCRTGSAKTWGGSKACGRSRARADHAVWRRARPAA